ncbi:MAG: leucine-rich repeat protein [Muribaculaceae bacterium]|nr:leucine-rich repeat protein [Muribaculaceae bacterium]
MNKLTKFSRAILAIAMTLMVALPTLAHDFEVGGLYYNYLDETAKTVMVTYKGNSYYDYSNEYTGSVTIPSSITTGSGTYTVTSINAHAFNDCERLTSVSIPNSVTKIGHYAFADCTGLTEITVPNSVTTIGNFAFFRCTSLTSITIPNSITSIGSDAFRSCSGLTVHISDLSAWCKIDFSDNESNPLYSAEKFKLNGTEITDLVIPNNITKIKQYAFYKFSGIAKVTIPNSVISIGSSAFYGCTGLTSLTIPNSVTNIDSYAFQSCDGLIEVTIGSSVAKIGTAAFGDCNNLLDVTSLNTMPQNIDANAFSTTAYTNAILTVPYKCNGLYAARTGWGSFNNIVEMEMPKIYLTLKFPESGTITHKEVYEEAVDLSFKANEGWEINSVTFNEEDVTAELDEDGNYTTPVLMADAILVVVFEKIDTSIEPISEKNDIKVYANNGEVRIVGADAQSEVAIYNSIGALVYKGYDKTIAHNENGVYILTVEGRTFKFAM